MTRDNFSKAYLTEPKQLSGVKRGLSKNPVGRFPRRVLPRHILETDSNNSPKQYLI